MFSPCYSIRRSRHHGIVFLVITLVSTPLAMIVASAAPLPDQVQFNRDIRPILSDYCFECHGPDAAQRQADLRLDSFDAVRAERSGRRVIEPGDLARSELYRRITAEDPDERMPPADSAKQLTEQQMGLIRQWIKEGAKWQKHWSFIAPQWPPLAHTSRPAWQRNAIDGFVLARLDREGLEPSPEAEKVTLIRRLTLDLTGLPPSPSEVDAFLADSSPAAFVKLVDRLLSSPRYGERMASRWLDAARYADTSGYQNDGPRSMWRWRDWVIDAYNRNMSFDRFTIEQIAGDLLPRATIDQQIATGFNRNHRGNAEGGIIPEEYAVEYVVDRVDTTATVWLGLTLGCARCHDHKYDPFTQKEFYQLFAYFNNVPEYGRAIKEGNSPPYIQAPTSRQQDQLLTLEKRLAVARTRWERLRPKLERLQAEWEAALEPSDQVDWTIREGLLRQLDFDNEPLEALRRLGKDAEPPSTPTARFESLAGHQAIESYVLLPDGAAASFDGTKFVNAGDVGNFGYFDKFSLAVRVRAESDGTVLSRMTFEPEADGYYVHLENGRIQVNLVKRWLDDSIRVETLDPLPLDAWHHVAVTYDGSRGGGGVAIYVDGQRQKLKVNHDFLNQSFANDQPLRIGAGHSPFRGHIDDVRIFDRKLSAAEVAIIATADGIHQIAAIPSSQRTGGQQEKLRAYFLDQVAPSEIKAAYRKLVRLQRSYVQFIENLPTAMVMQELKQPRNTFVLIRGQYDKPGEKVHVGVPAVLPTLPIEAENNRLGLAQWLVDRAHPLTARVAVNRYWQSYFGAGLVQTMEDFGSQGQRPSHPQLLDWLAKRFMDSSWDVKAMQRLIVTSATYRQSSRLTPRLLEIDPPNRLLARGPRLRLPAETIRDQALAASGLLVENLGGPSVKPYQPEGLWAEIASDKQYDLAQGGDLYRRSLYTYWKRTVSPPTMATFDAPSREACTLNRPQTNTPLQALVLMNDVTFVEAARVMAQRVMAENDVSPQGRIESAFRLVTSRQPGPSEGELLLRGFESHLAHYQKDHQSAMQLVSAGQSPRDESLDVGQLAAYTALISMILNLDETLTKE